MRAVLSAVFTVIAFFNGMADRIADAGCLRVEPFRIDASVQYALDDTNVLTSSSSPVTQGLLSPDTITVAGFASCGFHQRALGAANELVDRGIAASLVDKTFGTREEYQEWLTSDSGRAAFGEKAGEHTSSPFVWVDDGRYIGGADALTSLASMLIAGNAKGAATGKQ